MPTIRWARSWTSRRARTRSSRSEARRNRNRNALRSALTGSKIDLIDLRSEPLELRPGDWVVLASDGHLLAPRRRDRRRHLPFPPIHARRDGGRTDRRRRPEGRRRPGQRHRRGRAHRCGRNPTCRHDACCRGRRARRWTCARAASASAGADPRGPAVPPVGRHARRRVAGCRRCAGVLRRCAHARRAVAPADDALHSGGAVPCRRTAPANAAADRPAGPVAPAKPPAKTPAVEPAPPDTPPSTSPGRPAGESEEGSAPRASQSKSAATPPATSPADAVQQRVRGRRHAALGPHPSPRLRSPRLRPRPARAANRSGGVAPKPAKPRTGTAKLPGSSAAHRPASRRTTREVARATIQELGGAGGDSSTRISGKSRAQKSPHGFGRARWRGAGAETAAPSEFRPPLQ